MIKVAHEAPFYMMKEVRGLTDYDYALVHLFEKHPSYFDFFEDSLLAHRKVILDNSLFELGEAFESEEYVQWINKLRPTEFIIPDALGKTKKTLKLTEEFLSNHLGACPAVCTPIGVVQGSSYKQMVDCYDTMVENFKLKKIAFAFISDAYLNAFPHPNRFVSMSMGRVLVLSKMLEEHVIKQSIPHHLLGCMCPHEFSFYTGSAFNWIDTIDTSSPVVHGIKGIKLHSNIGVWYKESVKINDLLYTSPGLDQQQLVRENIAIFKSYLGR
jgi:hypothetical protein